MAASFSTPIVPDQSTPSDLHRTAVDAGSVTTQGPTNTETCESTDMCYHILERIRGTPDAPHIYFWKRLGIDYNLPIVQRDEAVPPNRVRLIVVKTVNDTGDRTCAIGQKIELELYEPYGSAAIEPYTDFLPEEVTEQHRHEEPVGFVEKIAGTLPIPPSFFDAYQLTVGDYLECFVTAIRPSGSDEWIVPYPAQTAPPQAVIRNSIQTKFGLLLRNMKLNWSDQ